MVGHHQRQAMSEMAMGPSSLPSRGRGPSKAPSTPQVCPYLQPLLGLAAAELLQGPMQLTRFADRACRMPQHSTASDRQTKHPRGSVHGER